MLGLTPISGAAISALVEPTPVQETDLAVTNIEILDSGLGEPHENMPPYFVGNWIIKT